MSWRRWKLGYRLSAVALSGEKTNFGWTPPILAGQHSLSRWIGKKCDCFPGGNRTWLCIFRAIVWCFTTKLETQWRARRQKLILYKVRLKESCDPWYESVLRKPKVSYNEFRISVAPLSSLEYSYCTMVMRETLRPGSSPCGRVAPMNWVEWKSPLILVFIFSGILPRNDVWQNLLFYARNSL